MKITSNTSRGSCRLVLLKRASPLTDYLSSIFISFTVLGFMLLVSMFLLHRMLTHKAELLRNLE